MKSITQKVLSFIVFLSVVDAFNLGPVRLKRLTSLNGAATITSPQKTKKDIPKESTQQKIAVLICPAQFCVPADYTNFVKSLHQRNPSIVTAKVAPLPRTEWIKVARQVPTQSFFSSELNNARTLKWYFDAIELGEDLVMDFETIVLRWKFDLTPNDVDILFSILKGKYDKRDKNAMKNAHALIRERRVVGGGGGETEGAFVIQNACTLVFSNAHSWVRPRTVKYEVEAFAIA